MPVPDSTNKPTLEPCWLCGAEAAVDPRYAHVGLYRCPDCAFLFSPERSVAQLHSLYTDDYFQEYSQGAAYSADEAQRRFEARHRLAWLAQHLPPGRLIEIGAAAGFFLDEARRQGWDVFGIEPAAGLVESARERFGVHVSAGFIETAAIPDQPFDAACAWHVVEHIRAPQESLRRLRQALRPDGLLFFEIPNIESDRAVRQGADWAPLDPDNHVGFYTRDNVRTLLDQVGFEPVWMESVSGHSYLRPRLAVRPGMLALRTVETVRSRARQGAPHPYKHEFMRVVARRGRDT